MAVGLAVAYHQYWPITVTPQEAWRWFISAVLFVLTALGIVWFHLAEPDLPAWTEDPWDYRFWALFWSFFTVPFSVFAGVGAVVTGRPVLPAVLDVMTSGTVVVLQIGGLVVGAIVVWRLGQLVAAWWDGRGHQT